MRKCGFPYETKEKSGTWTNAFGPSCWLSSYHLYGKKKKEDGPKTKQNKQSFISCLWFYFRSCQKQLIGNMCWLYRREYRLLMAPVPWCGTSSSSRLWLGNDQNVMNDPKSKDGRGHYQEVHPFGLNKESPKWPSYDGWEWDGVERLQNTNISKNWKIDTNRHAVLSFFWVVDDKRIRE